MPPCPHCSTELPAGTYYCKHCNRNLGAPVESFPPDAATASRLAAADAAAALAAAAAAADSPSNDVTATVPANVQSQLLPGEKVRHFSYIDSKGGCGSSAKAQRWIFVSDNRIVFEATVRENNVYKQTSGSIPLSKVAYVGTTTAQQSTGCNSQLISFVRVGSGGGVIEIAIPTDVEAKRIARVIERLISGS